MKFAFIPKAKYSIGQIIQVHGRPMRVHQFTTLGKNILAITPAQGNCPRELYLCVLTDAPDITEIIEE